MHNAINLGHHDYTSFYVCLLIIKRHGFKVTAWVNIILQMKSSTFNLNKHHATLLYGRICSMSSMP